MSAYSKVCKSVAPEKLYTLQVSVDSARLHAEKLFKISSNELGVDMQIVDMPLFRIFQSNFLLTKSDRMKEMQREAGMTTVYFNAGKIYLFTKNPGDLVQKMREKPILLDVYKIKGIQICPEDVIKQPLGNAMIPIPGCLCDHVMMSSNDQYHLPKSYEIKNTYCLVDEEYKPAGYISILIRLTCFGTCMTNNYVVVGKKLLFTNIGSFNEFLCTKVPYPNEEERKAALKGKRFCLPEQTDVESELESPPGPANIAGLVYVCKELALNDGYAPNVTHPNFPRCFPDVSVEEIPYHVERLRRKGFEQKIEEEAKNIVSIVNPGLHKACKHIGCGGNVCTGKK